MYYKDLGTIISAKMSVETIQEKIKLLKDYKKTTDVAAEVVSINQEIEKLEDFENGMGEGEILGQSSSV